ncbi:apolipoprotein N-acyltransferase [Polyangium sp. y55x31]|uniref:apolipoprotein N-acyltransferase n=1 Tax=Polyangium sp. y55x31 TaxID=3042688 RepID=UPI00248229C7|nr:apolipoprotein N-acyltransferase [Polyangium sp. y55x31]MDI1477430.1 apolipoprotein N-acyltransferase [Polyangium sp. y55x31]
MQRLRRHKALLLAIAGGILFALTSPPTDLYPAVFLGLALFAWSLEDAPTAWHAFGRGAAWATAAGIVGLRFVPSVVQRFTPLGSAAAYLALVLLAAGQSLIWAIGAAATHLVHRRARAPFVLAFAIGVFVAVSLPSVFAWTPAGLVSPWPSLVQLADIVGERGVSVIFAVSAAFLARALQAMFSAEATSMKERFGAKTTRPLAIAAAIPALLAMYGALRIRFLATQPSVARTIRVALLNQAVGPKERWDPKNHTGILRDLRRLTKDAEASGVDLTVWPEAAYPYPLMHGTTQAPRGPRAIHGDGARGPILFGLIMLEPPKATSPGIVETNSRNSATLVLPDGSLQPSYDKLELLWFGETVPLGAYIPWLRRIFQASGGLVPGTEPTALVLPHANDPVRMGVLNCYEDTLPGVGLRITRALRPNLLVNVTNDAWFVGTAEPELHARLAAMRAIEHRLDLVRSVNLGVLSWIDARGVVVARDASTSPSTLVATPTLRDGSLTIYGRFGDKPLAFGFVVAITAFVWRSRRKPGSKNETGASGEAHAGSGEAET